jgi:hypothetical protein
MDPLFLSQKNFFNAVLGPGSARTPNNLLYPNLDVLYPDPGPGPELEFSNPDPV